MRIPRHIFISVTLMYCVLRGSYARWTISISDRRPDQFASTATHPSSLRPNHDAYKENCPWWKCTCHNHNRTILLISGGNLWTLILNWKIKSHTVCVFSFTDLWTITRFPTRYGVRCRCQVTAAEGRHHHQHTPTHYRTTLLHDQCSGGSEFEEGGCILLHVRRPCINDKTHTTS